MTFKFLRGFVKLSWEEYLYKPVHVEKIKHFHTIWESRIVFLLKKKTKKQCAQFLISFSVQTWKETPQSRLKRHQEKPSQHLQPVISGRTRVSVCQESFCFLTRASVSSEPETAPFCFLSTWWAETDRGPWISSASHFPVSFLPLPVKRRLPPPVWAWRSDRLACPPSGAAAPLVCAASRSGCSEWLWSSCSWGGTGPGWTGGRWTWPGNEGL